MQPSTPGGGDAPGDRPPVDAPAMSLALTPRVEAWLTLPDGLTPIALDASPPELVASIEDRQLVVQPLRGVAGAFDVTVSATDAAGAPRSLLVRLEVEAGPWAFVEGVPWRARIAPSDAAALDPSRSSSELWASLSPSSTGGTRWSDATPAAFAWTGGALEPKAAPDGAIGATLRHARHGKGFGAVRRGSARPATLDSARFVWTELDWPAVESGELFDGDANGALAATVVSSAMTGNAEEHAIRCASSSFDSCVVVEPPGVSSSAAHALGPDGTLYGCATTAGTRAPFAAAAGANHGAVVPDVVGCFHDVTNAGIPIGEERLAGEETVGLVMTSPRTHVRVQRAMSTRLLAHLGEGRYGGAVVDHAGFTSAFALERMAPIDGVRFVAGREPEDPTLAHACGHTTMGPFADLEASTTTSDAPLLRRSHTAYRVALPPSADAAFVRFENTKAGRITFHLAGRVPFRLVDPGGHRVPAAFEDRTERCPDLVSFLQFEASEIGAYIIELGPTHSSATTLVYERGWPVAPVAPE